MREPLPPLQGPCPGLYRHAKGTLYVVTRLVRHSETLETLVEYHRHDDPDEVWVRPAAMWVERVPDPSTPGQQVPRFTFLREDRSSERDE